MKKGVLQLYKCVLASAWILCALFSSGMAYGQTTTVTGKITDQSDGSTLPGVNILVKGTTNGTITDLNGNYSLDVTGTDVLVFSSIGYLSVEEAVNNRTTIDIQLVTDITQLDEIVVVGYGTQKKSDITGAVSSLDGEELKKFASASPVDALQGNAAGVMVRKSSGNPRATANINIRGVRSLSGNGPLVIIDGVQGNYDLLNPDDIESMEVLKDGAAAAIYGSIAANGVIIVTTKSGKKGASKVEFSMFQGVDQIQNKLELTGSADYEKVARMAATNAGNTGPDFLDDAALNKANTNWVDALFDDGSFKNYNVAFTGATEDVNYMVSGSLNQRDGILTGEDRERKQIRTKLDFKKGRFKLNTNVYYVQTDDNIFGGSLRSGYDIMPIVPIKDSSKPSGYGYIDDAGYNDLPDHVNPLGENAFTTTTAREEKLVTNFTLTVDLLKGLKLTGRAGIDKSNSFYNQHVKPHKVANKREVFFHTLQDDRGQYLQTNFEGFLNYDKSLDRHNFNVMVGASRQEVSSSFIFVGAEAKKDDGNGGFEPTDGYLDAEWNTFNAANGGVFNTSSSNFEYARLGMFGRINYAFDDRYLLQVTVRRDGSSKFGEDKRYGVFPSVAAGWRISNESFFNVDMINNLKLRGSWGKLGSESTLGSYDWTVSTVSGYRYPFGTNGSQLVGTTIRDFNNPNLQWETMKDLTIGVDFGLLEDRISGSVNYYNRSTEDMIIDLILPPSSGLNNPSTNFGTVTNKGIEIELNYRKSTGDFHYGAGLVFSNNTNEVTKVGVDTNEFLGDDTTIDGDPANRTRLGHPIGALFLYQADGLFQTQEEVDAHNYQDENGVTQLIQPNAAPGDIKFRDVNGDGAINDDDLVFAGSGIPKTTLGLNLTADYKGFDFFVQFYGSFGAKAYNAIKQRYESTASYKNYLSSAANAWTAGNEGSSVPRAVFEDPNRNYKTNSTYFLEDADYMRIRNIQLGYTLPQGFTEKAFISRARVYVSLQNFVTFTGYSGIDPEIGGTLNAGTDFVSYPNVKTALFGLQITF